MLTLYLRRFKSTLPQAIGRTLYSKQKQFVQKPVASSSIKSQILSIEQFMNQRQKSSPLYLLQNDPSSIFMLGTDSLRIKLQLFVYFKQAFWQKNSLGEQKILEFIDKINNEVQQCKAILTQNPLDKKLIQELNLIKQYQKHISLSILPGTISQMQLCTKYLQQLIQFLSEPTPLAQLQIYHILTNLDRIIFPQSNNNEFNQIEEGWLLAHVFDLFLNKLEPHLHNLSGPQKSLIIYIAKNLKISNVNVLQFVKKELQQEQKQINLFYFLSGLNLLAINRSFPYQYFYKNKQGLMSFVEAAYNLSDKKVKNSIAMLQIFSRQRMMYCQKIVDRLLICIEQNLTATDIRQLARIFFYYSKLKYTIKYDFVIKIVERIYLFIDIMTEKDYSFIIKSLSNLNYQDRELVNKLKEFNYELFLANLKYGCEHLGNFYKIILEEVQNSFKQDHLRYQKQEDQIFHSQTMSNDNGQQKDSQAEISAAIL